MWARLAHASGTGKTWSSLMGAGSLEGDVFTAYAEAKGPRNDAATALADRRTADAARR